MDNSEHLQWIHDRLVHQHGENENYDYMIRLREIIENTRWIPIDEDNRPERGDRCLVKLNNGDVEPDMYVVNWWLNHPYGSITHWRYIYDES